MHRSVQLLIAATAAASGAAAADSVVTSLYLPFNDRSEYVATVIGADKDATTYAFQCAGDVKDEDCGMPVPGTVVQGESTWQYGLSYSNEAGFNTLTADCKLTSSADMASCFLSATDSVTGVSNSRTAMDESLAFKSDLQPVTITAGLDKLSGGAVPSATTASPTSAAQTTGGASAPQSSSDGAKSSSGAKSTATSTTGTPNAAAAVTQQAVLAGMAAVVGALAL